MSRPQGVNKSAIIALVLWAPFLLTLILGAPILFLLRLIGL